MSIYHKVENVKIEEGRLSMVVDGRFVSKSLSDISPALDNASEEEAQNYTVSASGYGIHWPLIDEDISIDGLLGVTHSPPQWKKSA
ncbi:DUF2442 domain-containing protein [Methylogaea oryzae]|uniref:DUF2442 domain-containing protein n=1 Tax=Methylogaea oryzae TaxID=1295382 RepID=A0A8D4VRJ6_9GAMM|nr:DUF2442 domain-containing protein [Methylogaea oryzae]BBL72753.1 hypothetical protein MoryE10_33590 [Methylogaea oryzae]